jgi:hypothetical protein
MLVEHYNPVAVYKSLQKFTIFIFALFAGFYNINNEVEYILANPT